VFWISDLGSLEFWDFGVLVLAGMDAIM